MLYGQLFDPFKLNASMSVSMSVSSNLPNSKHAKMLQELIQHSSILIFSIEYSISTSCEQIYFFGWTSLFWKTDFDFRQGKRATIHNWNSLQAYEMLVTNH